MRRPPTALVTFATLVVLASTAAAQHRVHVHEVRAGGHPDFDRVVVELDGPTDVSWERGPEPNAERFYLDADLGRRSRVVHTGLAKVGDVRLTAMRVGTRVELEPRERRVRAYVLAKPTRLVIDLAPPGSEPFAVPKGITPLEAATSVEPHSEAAPEASSQPEPEAESEPQPEEEAGPPAEEVGPVGPPEEPQAQGAEPSPQAEEPQAEAPPPQREPSGEGGEAAPAPSAPAPEAAAPVPELPRAAPQPPALEPVPGFPWALGFGTLAFIAALVVSYLYLRERMDRPAAAPRLPRSPAGALTPSGVDPISPADLRDAADATSVLEQRLDEEVRARVALEERLAQAGEELKVLRDRVHRVERRREEVH
ncbi:MAG TPA: hypothetical protein VEN47_05475 [Myxococcota bacterium]|nr:hypothetical protein [Myxococcota bacterium]